MAAVKKSRGKVWTDEETKALIDLWGEEAIQIALENAKTSRASSQVYKTLLMQLESKGFKEITLKGIVNKMKKLRQKYKAEKDKTRKSGSGRQKKWKFFDQIDHLLSHRHNVTPLVVLDTMATESQGSETEYLDETLDEDNSNEFENTVGNLAEKYGKGKKSTVKCKTCSYEQGIFSSGVHTSDGGAVMVYDTNEEFVCPNCGIDGDIEEIDEENGNNGPTTGDIQENDTSKKDGIENNLPNSSDELKKPAIRAKRKSTVEKGLEAVFDKFKNAANEDFERYKELEKMRIEKEHAFQREQMKLENQQRKEEREHEMQMLLMMLGNTNQPRNADTFPMPSILNAYPHASVQQQNYGSVSSISTPSYAVHEDKTYFQL